MVDVIDIKELSGRIKPIVNRGFRSLGKGDFKDADIYFGGVDGNAEWERHPARDELVHIIAGSTELDIIVDDEIEVGNQ